jgi:hypothetical protein
MGADVSGARVRVRPNARFANVTIPRIRSGSRVACRRWPRVPELGRLTVGGGGDGGAHGRCSRVARAALAGGAEGGRPPARMPST